MAQLKDRTVFITGSGGVLGSTYVRRMLAEGAKVIATDLAGDRAEALQAAHGENSDFRFYELDVSDEAGIKSIFQRVMADGWSPNVVLNNAAITGEMLMGKGKSFPDFADTSVEDFEKTLRTNLTGAFMIARQMDRDIVGKYPATLINVASMYALNGAHHGIYNGMPFKNFSAYGVTKAGIHGLTVWVGRILGQAAGDGKHDSAGGGVQRSLRGISATRVRVDHGQPNGRTGRDCRRDVVPGFVSGRVHDWSTGERGRWLFRLVIVSAGRKTASLRLIFPATRVDQKRHDPTCDKAAQVRLPSQEAVP